MAQSVKTEADGATDIEKQALPASMGSAKSAAVAYQKGFYSPHEVDRLGARQLDNPVILNKIIRSMKKWR